MADINGYRFGVCFCNLDFTDEVENLEIFESYENAFKRYYEILSVLCFKENPRWIPNDLWIIWIRQNNKIEQWEQLIWNTKCKTIELEK